MAWLHTDKYGASVMFVCCSSFSFILLILLLFTIRSGAGDRGSSLGGGHKGLTCCTKKRGEVWRDIEIQEQNKKLMSPEYILSNPFTSDNLVAPPRLPGLPATKYSSTTSPYSHLPSSPTYVPTLFSHKGLSPTIPYGRLTPSLGYIPSYCPRTTEHSPDYSHRSPYQYTGNSHSYSPTLCHFSGINMPICVCHDHDNRKFNS
jgi:hypothetical protein